MLAGARERKENRLHAAPPISSSRGNTIVDGVVGFAAPGGRWMEGYENGTAQDRGAAGA